MGMVREDAETGASVDQKSLARDAVKGEKEAAAAGMRRLARYAMAVARSVY
jgi:hypothetical protein